MRLQLKIWVHGAMAVLVFSGALLINASAISAVQHAMSGTLAMGNPSTIGTPTRFKQQNQLAWGNPAITATPKVVNTTGPNKTLSIPKSVFRLDGWGRTTTNLTAADPNGFRFRSFPNFTNVNQLTSIFTTAQQPAVFAAGAGAAQGTGVNGTVNWCPKMTGCAAFGSGSVAPGLVQISPRVGGSKFGGTFKLLRNIYGGKVYFVVNKTPLVIWGSSQRTLNRFWTPGLTNGANVTDMNGQPSGYISPVLTNGLSGIIVDVGNPIGPAATANGAPIIFPDGPGTGFKMTTGSIYVADATPTTSLGGNFRSTTTGSDARTAGGNGNITLVGGSVSYGGATGNVFFRVTQLKMTLPEPGASASLAVGMLGLLALARIRRKN